MKILYYNTLESTQKYLKSAIQNDLLALPIAIVAEQQTDGVGSRDNSWDSLEGNLFLSFAINKEELPKDLKMESASIYFSYILQETLNELGSKVYLKWPNDLYIKDKKVGGMITTVVKDVFICGLGLNLKTAPISCAILDLEIDKNILLEKYFKNIEKKRLWKQVFSKYKLNFYNQEKVYTHVNGERVLLEDATLENDGSISINAKRIYSLR